MSPKAMDIELRELKIYNENEEQALSIILKHLDAANARLVEKKTAYEAWLLLGTTHVTKTANCQYQRYQELASTRQQPNKHNQPTCNEHNKLQTVFLTISNLDPTEENESFKLNLSIARKVDSTTITESFRTEQTRRDVAARTKEAGLTIRLGQSSRRGPKAGSPTCAHCQKAHKSEDCYTKHPDKNATVDEGLKQGATQVSSPAAAAQRHPRLPSCRCRTHR
ncbi:hypothetical protein M407DRAFT_24020 [Tulasnella calospora MUT 4182]|uniref:Uncharacterized protein n=1 Tax=Tulasnella calospora MUT 4182 TaxID=1051891 RepID=A0A0C3LZ53_9AGAM|nr:hypothetical protein M407DRAFT_24020 [Tulasnella calospora MUT 4182]